ncbi:hypothetical protein IMX07_11010 [bacterium]|nr:hypothetical protein [bacterium]
MKNLKAIVVVAGAAAFFCAAAIPAFAFDTNQVPVITADVVPTQQQIQQQLSDLHARLLAAKEAGSDNPVAESNYLEAQRMYEFGRYDTAARDISVAKAALLPIPNWLPPSTASR